MNELKVRGIVLRAVPSGDKDKRLLILTAEWGKIYVTAKGAMSSKSRFRTVADEFCYGEFVLTISHSYYYLKEATLLENFYDLRLSLDRLTYAQLLTETAETLSLDGQENAAVLTLLLRSLLREAKAPEGKESLPACVGVFRMLAEGGFYPNLTLCCLAGEEDAEDHDLSQGDVAFIPYRGQVFCASCLRQGRVRETPENIVLLSQGALKALNYMLSQPEEKAFSFEAGPQVMKQVESAVTAYLTAQTDKPYRSLMFLAKIHHD